MLECLPFWKARRERLMRIYNTKTLKIEEFIPIKEGEVKMYVCGPTVYSDIHIGNARPIVVFDTLRRVFEAIGYKVYYVSNYTDVDDKIIKAAKEKEISEVELTDEMIERVEAIRKLLNTEDLYKTPRVTETMEDIIEFIDELVMSGHAYVVDGDVFFRTSSIDDYGSLSNQVLEDLQAGARIEENDKKESPLDFVLWKKTEVGIKWPSRYSLGRPGWHTECVVMINKELGRNIDIHGGGKDLRFPHHENERAQAKALYNTGLANYWMHNGMIDMEGVKMSKSLGNIMSAKDVLATYDPMVVRWLLLSAHYRADLNISDEVIKGCVTELNKVTSALKQAHLKLALADVKTTNDKELYEGFLKEMCDDLNTPNAYSVIFEAVKTLNSAIRVRDVDLDKVASLTGAIEKMLDVLGIRYERLVLTDVDREIYDEWTKAKTDKDFTKADELRAILMQRGIL